MRASAPLHPSSMMPVNPLATTWAHSDNESSDEPWASLTTSVGHMSLGGDADAARLPRDLIVNVLLELSARDLLSASHTCSAWHRLVVSERVWARYLRERHRYAFPGRALVYDLAMQQALLWQLATNDPLLDASAQCPLEAQLHLAFRGVPVDPDLLELMLLSLADPDAEPTLVVGDTMLLVYLGVGAWGPLGLVLAGGVRHVRVAGVSRTHTVVHNAGRATPTLAVDGRLANYANTWHAAPTEAALDSMVLDVPGMPLVELRNLTCAPVDDAPDRESGMTTVFCRDGVSVHVRDVTVRGSSARAVQFTNSCWGHVSDCVFVDCHGGVYFYDSVGAVERCRMRGLNTDGVAAYLPCASVGSLSITDNHVEVCVRACVCVSFSLIFAVPQCSSKSFGVLVRTKPACKDLQVEVARNFIDHPINGIFVCSVEIDPDKGLPIIDASRPGCVVSIVGNTIVRPTENGIFVKAPCAPAVNGSRCVVSRNTVQYARELGIMYTLPDSALTLGVSVLPDNVLEDTGDTRPPLPGLTEAYRNQRCSRTVTGARKELQVWFVCEECGLSRANESGVCLTCFELEHKDHRGAFKYATLFPGFCGCSTKKCAHFDKDPPLKDTY